MPKSMMLVFSKPASEDVEAEYNQWYSEKHLPDLLNVPGVITATRYKLESGIELMPGIGGDPRSYLAVYEIEGDTREDMEKFSEALKKALEEGVADVSPYLDMVDISASFAIPITDRLTR